ncbi:MULTISPECIES: hypothetical protein [Methylosinus]|uniref:Uncharacterized protein n=1 Tax=Methylosinus trichosporium (strain ATCC 35070 / NCIMB 11131 / UNIQEM 75 / OB3b) TaxID=595536 RepID=A0A2D2CY99_METT3|nr:MULTISPECIES: hypothetical protein [Methylosinus]ATQ67718.1 hypothetical protein CQW49_07310 [Methylosinus trichosporium OB3b]OBS51174.1 hypothetical protein A8B73_17800 [Methylosinus sp. 3S-1]
MPTPSCHAQTALSQIVSGLATTTSDRIALALAPAVGTAPLWIDRARQISELGAILGPGLAALFVASKIVLTWVQIWRAARAPLRE